MTRLVETGIIICGPEEHARFRRGYSFHYLPRRSFIDTSFTMSRTNSGNGNQKYDPNYP